MKTSTNIKVIGIGGSGGNAISRMKKQEIKGVELIALNTDAQDLKKTKADKKIRFGNETTLGLGTGMNPKIGRKAAKESEEEIKEILKGADLVFVTYGAGGGTGTGAGPVVAKLAKESGALTMAVVTKPFAFEGDARKKIAEKGIKKLKKNVDSLITISNDKLLTHLGSRISVVKAFKECDDILRQAVQGISDLILLPGIINVDFADVESIIRDSGTALFGIGRASGERRAKDAAKKALESPLLDIAPKKAEGILFNVSGGLDISLSEIEEVAEVVKKEVNPQSDIIFGAVQDEDLKKGEIKVTIIATGF